jgi:hypothetical protein
MKRTSSPLLVILLALFLYASLASPAQAAPPGPELPPGFYQIAQAYGVHLYRKDYEKGNPDFVQVIDLSQMAALRLLYAPISETRPGKGVYGGDDPRFVSQPLQVFWDQVSAEEERAFCVTNGSFFYMPEHPTRLAFPLKVDGKIITDGWGIDTYPEQKLMLELWDDRANIRDLTKQALYSSSAPDIIAGLDEAANNRAKYAEARTFVGIDDRDRDGTFETVLMLNTLTAVQKDVAEVLRSFGADKVMMLDGGGSTQLLCRSDWYIKSERLIPQAIAVIGGSLPPVSFVLLGQPNWPVLLEGEFFPLILRVRNTGLVSWTIRDTQFILEASGLGSQEILPLQEEVKPGGTLVLTNTLASYTYSGIYPVTFKWGILHEGKTYSGEPINTNVIVLPMSLAPKRGELQEQIKIWTKEQPDQVRDLAAAWIEQHSGFSTKALGSQSPESVQLKDALWVPLIMLPVLILLGLAIARSRQS